jgi:hypothetical protein
MYGKGCSDAKDVNLPGWKGLMSKMEVAGREERKRTRGRYVNKDGMGDFPGRSGVKPAKMVGKCGKITPSCAESNKKIIGRQ